MAEIKITLDELKNVIELNKELMDKMDNKVRLSVVNNKIKIGMVPLNALTINLLKPWALNLLIKKLGGINGVIIRNMTILDDNIYIEICCECENPGQL